LVAGLEVVLAHIPADDVVGVLLALVDAVHGLVCLLFFVAAFLGAVLVDGGADDGDSDAERFEGFDFAVRDELKVLEFVGGFGPGVDNFNL
jgi:hypothetical protein